MTCTHTREKAEWIEADDWYEEPAHWHYSTEYTTEDIDVGRFRCTQCGLVMYYTGSWKRFYEEGIPCPGSDLVKKHRGAP